MADPQLMRALGRIEGKLDAFHETLTKHILDDDKVEARVRKTERRQSWFMGGLAVSWGIIGLAWKLLTS